MFDSIVNRNEYFSDHYLDAVIAGDLTDLRKRWKEAEENGDATTRTRLGSLRGPLFEAKGRLKDGSPEALREANSLVLEAFGYSPEEGVAVFERGEAQTVVVPILARGGGTEELPRVIVIEASFADETDGALAFENDGVQAPGFSPAGLRSPVTVLGEQQRDPAAAISAIFESEHPPHHVLVVAGATLVLATRGKWHQGRYLAVDLGTALERGDATAKGELETIAALFSYGALVPLDETAEAEIDRFDAKSVRNATGVSEDLREGVRHAVETIANEAIIQRKNQKLAVYDHPGFARQITAESLRYLYRILFLLYAESRPELEVVPVLSEAYERGYGLERLRELTIADLHTDEARRGTHIDDSLRMLFKLVNTGHRHIEAQRQGGLGSGDDEVRDDDTGFIFHPLESTLFSPKSTPLLDSFGLRNKAMQKVLEHLLLSAESKGKERQFVSYQALGINQLGAVYERLMAYSGFLADEDLYEIREIDKKGEQKSGGASWVVPVHRADEFPDAAFVTERDEETGEDHRVRYRKGEFVYRLSGRDRQRSASYYTPEVLTEFVVRHALEELLGQGDTATSADEILAMTICEPALGSGAFLNEAINQLASAYLSRKQLELGETIDPERYPEELQKVKAHFALHQAYGVDLNEAAVELAEVSLWLNAMHAGFKAPWFGLHLRRGNSLVGARRAVYRTDQLKKKAWLKAPYEDRPLTDQLIGSDEIHHFLIPGEAWGAVASTKEAKELAREEAKALADWAKRIKAAAAKESPARLLALSGRVEELWNLAVERLSIAEGELRRNLKLYGQPDPDGADLDLSGRSAVEAALDDENTALARLRLVMDAWCALWFWPLDARPPEWPEWLEMLELALGLDPDDAEDLLPLEPTLDDIETIEDLDNEVEDAYGMASIGELMERFEWLSTAREIEESEGFFHWDLEFGHRMREGGFDLLVGNPPWVRPDWDDALVLVELDPAIVWLDAATATRRRDVLLENESRMQEYLSVRVGQVALASFLSATTVNPLLAGLRNDLYHAFLPQVWRMLGQGGMAGILHPEGVYTASGGASLRRIAYKRLRRHWHFVNYLPLFPDIGGTRTFSVNIYGGMRGDSTFSMMANAQAPATVDLSLVHDGRGSPGGVKSVAGAWDRTPHRERLLQIDGKLLADLSKLVYEVDDSNHDGPPLLLPFFVSELDALNQLARVEQRLDGRSYRWTSCWNEKIAKTNGIIRRETAFPSSVAEVVLQGPHFTVSNPFAKQPNENCQSKGDWSGWDLESLPERVIPRTNYQRACSRERYDAESPQWEGRPAADRFRLIHRSYVGTGGVRSIQASLVPPGPLHVHGCHTIGGSNDLVSRLLGLWSSVPMDYLFKVSGQAHLQDNLARQFPFPTESDFYPHLLHRTLRLNCLTRDYAPFWEDLWTDHALAEGWTIDDPRLPTLASPREWSMGTPLRRDLERRQALVEIDALGALILGISADQLCAMYRVQFGVLRKYEWEMRHDANGREVDKKIWQAHERGEDVDLGRFEPPFTKPDREAEMRAAYAEFERRVGG